MCAQFVLLLAEIALWHAILLLEVHAAVKHVSAWSDALAVSSSLPNIKPVSVTDAAPLGGPFWKAPDMIIASKLKPAPVPAMAPIVTAPTFVQNPTVREL
jgi:hypothetical protein